jgi:hypothetical protein
MAKHSEPPEENNSSEPRPWISSEEFTEEHAQFLRAVDRFVGRGQPMHSWCEFQQLQKQLAEVIRCAGPTEDWIKTLRAMVRIANKDRPLSERRWHAVRSIDDCGAKWKLADWQESNGTRCNCLNNLVTLLSCDDDAFEGLRDQLDYLGELLDDYETSSSGKVGRHNAAVTLTIMIADKLPGALGLTVTAGDSRGFDRVRLRLTKDFDDYESGMKTAER